MPFSQRKPSITSLVAFFLIVSPLVYVLSYAPVVKVCRRTVETREYPRARLNVSFLMPPFVVHHEAADSSLYPLYSPVDWLIDKTPVQKPLFLWADLWGVREAFEYGYRRRHEPMPEYEPLLFELDIERLPEPMYVL